jgi:glutamine cyclotransferase
MSTLRHSMSQGGSREHGSRLRAYLAVVVAMGVMCAPATAGAAPHVTIHTAGFPTSVSASFGSIWVTSHRGGYLYRINPSTDKVAATIDVSDALCMVPIVAENKLWVSGCEVGQTPMDGFTYEVDPTTNRVVGRIVGLDPHFGAGSIWTTVGRSVERIDPKSGVVLAKIEVPDAKPASITEWGIGGIADGSVWAITDTAAVRISTTTNAVTNVITLPSVGNAVFAQGYSGSSPIAILDRKIWFSQYPFLYQVDPVTNIASPTTLKVGPFSQWGDGSLSAGNGALWVRTTDTQVVRIDPLSDQVTARYRATGGGGGITIAFGSLWTANAISDSVWRTPIADTPSR